MTSKLIYKGTAHGHTKTKDRVNITLEIHEIQLLNSALSIYYSTRYENNPLKQDALTLKQRFLTIDPNIAEWSHES